MTLHAVWVQEAVRRAEAEKASAGAEVSAQHQLLLEALEREKQLAEEAGMLRRAVQVQTALCCNVEQSGTNLSPQAFIRALSFAMLQ